MPEPHADETQDEFVSRCIPMVLEEGTAEDEEQAAAICFSIWRDEKGAKAIQKTRVPLHLKAMDDRDFEGHAAIFGNVDLGGEVVLPGAFKKSLARHKKRGTWPPMFWMHNPAQVPGVWKAIEEDELGLRVVGTLAETELGDEVRVLLKMKAVRGLSFGYPMPVFEYDKDGNRLLKEIDIWEASIVSMAMNPLARVEAVKARLSREGEYVPDCRSLERMLRDVGISQLAAKRMISACRGLMGGRGLGDPGPRDVDPGPRDVHVEAEIVDRIRRTSASMLGLLP